VEGLFVVIHVSRALKYYLLKKFFFSRFCLFVLETEHKQEGPRERERESQANSVLSAEPDTGLSPTTPRS